LLPDFFTSEQHMKKFLFRRKTINSLLALTVLTLTLSGVAFSQALAITVNQFVPFALLAFVPCANGGAGELVLVQGTLHLQDHITINDNRVNIKTHAQPQGAEGVGLTTGDKYQATGVTQEQDSIPLVGGAAEFTFINNFRIIGQRDGNNLLVHQTVHVTVNANGDVTTIVDNQSIDCQ
jgi:hypothetical protein